MSQEPIAISEVNFPSPWPAGCLGAVSLTFDDGMSSHLSCAVPLLNESGLQATFYLNPRGDNWAERLAPWREVARMGHEIGNHSLSHPCSRAARSTRQGRYLEDMTIDDITTDIVEAERRLQAVFPEQHMRTFCYPCYLSEVGIGLTQRSYVPVVAQHFIAARGRGEEANHPLTCNMHYLWSWPVERMWSVEMVGLVERAVRQGCWCILTLHGIHQTDLSVTDRDLQELCAFLADARERIWTAPLVTVASRIVAWRTEHGIGS